MSGIPLDKTMSKIIKTLFALALVFCMGCGEVEESGFIKEAFENQWWEVEAYPYCFTINTASQKLWYISYEKNGKNVTLHKPAEYEFTAPNKYSWDGNGELFSGEMGVVTKGDCWDLIYGDSRWESACKCESIPQHTLNLATDYINIEHDKEE